MRALSAAFVLLCLALLPAAEAQLASPSFEVTVTLPSGPVQPGSESGLVLHLERICPNPASMLDPQQVSIQFLVPEGAVVDGPAQATFPSQTCAAEPQAAVDVPYMVRVPAATATPADGNASVAPANGTADNGTATVLPFEVRVRPEPTGPLSPGSPEVSSAFTLAVERPRPAAAAAQPVEQAAPSPAFAFVGLALVALAAALRRRA